MGYTKHRKVLAVAALLLLATSTAGCSVVEQKASEAAEQLTDAASREFIRQACAPLQDGRIDAGEMRVLTSLVGAIDGGGLPAEIIEPLKELADSGDGTASEAIQQRLVQACDNAGAYAG
ncbi:hypothetical protein OK351_16550 [Glutamicibacter sp. MNS18]|uniref:hypothetical protein n=1 Tax=Glutamicibacter sp. MNS18 TaxID=2989817 RepID=UPI00223684A0|nr:hypothetical protein [Glutamicibacter sp. MNS18]MCW4467096.1 hypothetical protein [Glutamicibacter sp. MNS18]